MPTETAPTQATTDLYAFAKELRVIVETSNPINSSRAFARGRDFGISNRTMAGMAGCGESHVRNMLKVFALPPDDQALIENGAPYKPFLNETQGCAVEQEANTVSQVEIDHAAERGALALANWCEVLKLGGPYAKQVLTDVKTRILGAEAQGRLKPSDVTWQGTVEEALAGDRESNDTSLRGVDKLNAAVRTIARSLVRLIPNADARCRAINVALANPSLRGTGR